MMAFAAQFPRKNKDKEYPLPQAQVLSAYQIC